MDFSVTRYYGVAWRSILVQAEVGSAVSGKGIQFLEGIVVKEKIQPFSGCQLAFGMLLVNALPPAAEAGLGAKVIQFLEPLVRFGFNSHWRLSEWESYQIKLGWCKQWVGVLHSGLDA